MVQSERDILEKLRKVEALFAGAATEGERLAAVAARARIRARLEQIQKTEPSEEWRFAIENAWSRRLLMALAIRYGLSPYRRRGQHRSSIMILAPKSFIEGTLIPEFNQCNEILVQHLDALAARIIAQAIGAGPKDIDEVP